MAAGLRGVCEYAVEDAMTLGDMSGGDSGSASASDSSSDMSSGSSSSSVSGGVSGGDSGRAVPQYDLTWSMESGEHMPNKTQFVNQLYRMTAPGGRVIIVTWCHR